MTDAVDATPEVTLRVPGCPDITVADGQGFEFEFDDEGCRLESQDGLLKIQAPSAILRVTATDISGNSTAAAVSASRLDSVENDDAMTLGQAVY